MAKKKEQKIECPGGEGEGGGRIQNSPKAFGELIVLEMCFCLFFALSKDWRAFTDTVAQTRVCIQEGKNTTANYLIYLNSQLENSIKHT